MAKIAMVIEGKVEVHIRGVGAGGDYATLCGLDGDDPAIGQEGSTKLPRGAKITCSTCYQIWKGLRQIRLRESDFDLTL